ncbi:MAG: dipeptidase [bacterium]
MKSLSPAHLEDFFTFLRFASISTEPKEKETCRQCAEWLAERLKRTGLQTEVCPTAGHPIVLARNQHRPDRKTVMIYGHYDVQPVDPLELWRTPPFEPHLANGIVTARGASDNKGQIFAHILGVEKALQETGDLPVNLILFIEGEEESGSAHLGEFLQKNRKSLACDVIVISDSEMVGPNQPAFTYGLRGIAAMEVSLTGPATDLHSGNFGGAVVNPVTALARLVATLHDASGRVAVEGFYNRVRPMQAWERAAWGKLGLDEKHFLKITQAPALGGEEGFTPIERIWARPTAEVNGLWGGYQGAGTKTVLPKEAHAKLTFRLVPDQQPKEILNLVETHFRKFYPPAVRLNVQHGHSGEPYLVDPHTPFGQAAQRALHKAFGVQPALTREGGSIPIVADFKSILGVDTLLLGLALTDCAAHAPNETFPLENMEAGVRMNRALLEELAK